MKLKCIGSSSSGNCYLLESSAQTLILECGVKINEIKKALGWSLSKVCGCLVSHRHKDHSLSLPDLAKCGIPIYSHEDVFVDHKGATSLFCKVLVPLHWNIIGGFKVFPFPLVHTSSDDTDCPCYGFLIDNAEMGRMLFVTDTMMLRYKFPKINHLLIECNYSDEKLEENINSGLVPAWMRKRLLDSHMELKTTKSLLESNDLSQSTEVVLIHLSGRNSEPDRFVRECAQASGLPVYIAKSGFEIELSKEPY